MKNFATIGAVVGLASVASAHMEMKDPPPFRSKFNKHTTNEDYSMTSPLNADGSNFPCKGYQSLVGSPQGEPVATWTPGESYSMTITGGTDHNGGSCQASLSFDNGETWKTIHSYIGNCPVAGDSSYDFVLPSDTQTGDALFAWTWFNQVGNREMYMNCAAITIGGGNGAEKRGADDPIADRPDMFVANVGNGCKTVEGKDLEFPNPGPDVDRNTPEGQTAGPEGSCAGAAKTPARKSKTMSVVPSSSFVSFSPISRPSSPGGVFHTKTAAAPNSKPTTLSTSTVKSTSTTESADKPDPTGAAESAFKQGAPCQNEGDWNCVGGSKYQRCASGVWSALMDVYAGTTCTPGQSEELQVA